MRRSAIASLTITVLAQSKDAPRNDLPQPYRTTRDWGQLPPGMKCADRKEAPILKYDANDKLLKNWGEGMFVFPHGATIDRDGNLWAHRSVHADGTLCCVGGRRSVISVQQGFRIGDSG